MPGYGLLMVPAARSPHKPAGPVASAHDRVQMLRLGLEDVGLPADAAGVWTDEIDRAEGTDPSYWVDTLARARSLIGEPCDLRFVIGADQLTALARWHDPHRILKLASPIILLRGCPSGEADRAQLVQEFARSGDWSDAEVACIRRGFIAGQPVIDASSTRVRTLLRVSPESSELDSLLTPRVLELVRQRDIYRQRSEG